MHLIFLALTGRERSQGRGTGAPRSEQAARPDEIFGVICLFNRGLLKGKIKLDTGEVLCLFTSLHV